MKNFIKYTIFFFLGALFLMNLSSVFSANTTLGTLDQFTASTTPYAENITQRINTKPLRLTGLNTGSLCIDANGFATTTGCSSGVGTSTNPFMASYFVATSTTASSTFANGLNITAGCFALNGVCKGILSGTGVATRVPFYNDPTTLTTDADFVYDSSGQNLTVPHLIIPAVGGVAMTLGNTADGFARIVTDTGVDLHIEPYTNLLISGHVKPLSDNTYDLGAVGARWKNIFFSNILSGVTGTFTGDVTARVFYGLPFEGFQPQISSGSVGDEVGLLDGQDNFIAVRDTTSGQFWYGRNATGDGGIAITTANGDVLIPQKLGIGTSSPFTSLGVAGTITANNINATGTVASTLKYASSTALTVSGNSYLGTVTSGTWNGSTIAIANGGTNSTSISSRNLVWFDGTSITATSSILTVGSIVATTTATSTFGGGISLAGGNVNIATGGSYLINNARVLNSTTLGAGVTGSSLTSVGTITTGVWSGTAIAIAKGGTNSTSIPSRNLVWFDGTSITATSSILTVGSLIATTTATSTFTGPVRAVVGAEIGTQTSGAGSYATRQPSIIFNRNDIPNDYTSALTTSYSGDPAATTLNFELANGPSTRANAMTLTGGGRVGIGGNTAPTVPLDVTGDSEFTGTLTSDGGYYTTTAYFNGNEIGGRTSADGLNIHSGNAYALGPAFQMYPSASSFYGGYFDAGSVSGGNGVQGDWVWRTAPGGDTRMSFKQGTGYLGVGTTTPIGSLVVQGTSTVPVLLLASTTGAPLFSVNGAGHIVTGGGTPTVSSCGVTPSISGNDTAGTVTVGTGVVTACTITFAKVRSNTPRVVGVVTGGGLSIAGGYSAKSTSAVTFSFAATVAGGTFDYYIVE